MSTDDAVRARDGVDGVLARLRTILAEVWDDHPAGTDVNGDASLLSLGVDSLALVTLLDRVERTFVVDWDPDDPPGAHSSLASLARRAVPNDPDGTDAPTARDEHRERR